MIKQIIIEVFGKKTNDETIGKTIQQFYAENNIVPEELSWAGSGDFGTAYHIGDGRILKETSSKSEFEIARELIGKGKSFDSFAEFYAAEIVEGKMLIIVEELEIDSDIEDLFYQLQDLLDQEGLPMQYVGSLDIDEMDIDKELIDFATDVYGITHDYRRLGIEASDIRPENMGRGKDGKVKAFDIEDRSRT